MTVWFDVEDLYHYFRGGGNKRISGIQRLSVEIFRGAMALGADEIRFVRHGRRMPQLLTVEWSELMDDFGGDEARSAPPVTRVPAVDAAPAPPPAPAPVVLAPAPRSRLRDAARSLADRMPREIRQPLVLASVMQLQAVASLAQFGAALATYPAQRAYHGSRRLADDIAWRARGAAAARARPKPHVFDTLAKPGDTLLVLGAPWNRERYSDIARYVRDERRMRFGVLVHDLVPIRHPEWCHRGVPRAFLEWYTDVLPFCDVVFANSQFTADDVEAYAREAGLALNGRVRKLPIGTGFGPEGGDATRTPRLPSPGSYVLFVSTMEARKNHALAVRIWSLLLEDVRAGRREADSVPDLVFAGRIGWLVADLIEQLHVTEWLGGKIRFVPDPTDGELRALYIGALFTFFPSLFEGWGLPVTESLAMGKPCLCSDAASLPEAGGTLCRYFDPENLATAYAAVVAVLDDRPGLAAWEERVRREFRPVPWTDTARALIDALRVLDAAPTA